MTQEKTSDLEDLAFMILEERGSRGIHSTEAATKVMAYYFEEGIDIKNESIKYISEYFSKLEKEGTIKSKKNERGGTIYYTKDETLHNE